MFLSSSYSLSLSKLRCRGDVPIAAFLGHEDISNVSNQPQYG